MREIQVVGALHAVSVPTFVGREMLEVKPPDDFIETLGLGASDTAAVELFPGARDLPNHYLNPDVHVAPEFFESDRERLNFSRFRYLGGGFFFRELGDYLENNGIAVYEIDDRRLAYELAGKIAERHDRLSIEIYMKSFLNRRQEKQFGRASALGAFVDTHLREDRMFANLAGTDASVVILGRAHADRLATDTELQELLGVTVTRTWYVEPEDEHFWPSPFSHIPARSNLREANSAELQWNARDAAIQKELSRRRHNAFSIGRVLNRKDPAPDFLGRFYISGPAEKSLFELTVDDRDGDVFQGTIRDVLGDATIEGKISKGHVAFLKTYDAGMCDPNKTFLPIHYQGKWREDMNGYEGTHTNDPERQRRLGGGVVFRMVPFAEHALAQLDYFAGWHSRS